MAIGNHERAGKALDLLKTGLAPFVEREFKNLTLEVHVEAAEGVPDSVVRTVSENCRTLSFARSDSRMTSSRPH